MSCGCALASWRPSSNPDHCAGLFINGRYSVGDAFTSLLMRAPALARPPRTDPGHNSRPLQNREPGRDLNTLTAQQSTPNSTPQPCRPKKGSAA